jgi:hypothetical protein
VLARDANDVAPSWVTSAPWSTGSKIASGNAEALFHLT